MVRRDDQDGEKVFWLCAALTGTKIDELMQAREHGYERVWKMSKNGL